MSVEYEIEENGRYLCFDAYSTHLDLDVGDGEEDSEDRTAAVLEAATVRQLRRFLEWCYPASEDPEHEPDPWERSTMSDWKRVDPALELSPKAAASLREKAAAAIAACDALEVFIEENYPDDREGRLKAADRFRANWEAGNA